MGQAAAMAGSMTSPRWPETLPVAQDMTPRVRTPLDEREVTRMNLAQRVAIVLGLLLIAAMALFPPWMGKAYVIGIYPSGYHLVFARVWAYGPVLPEHPRRDWVTYRVDTCRLLAQWVFAAGLTAAAVVALGSGKRPATELTERGNQT